MSCPGAPSWKDFLLQLSAPVGWASPSIFTQKTHSSRHLRVHPFQPTAVQLWWGWPRLCHVGITIWLLLRSLSASLSFHSQRSLINILHTKPPLRDCLLTTQSVAIGIRRSLRKQVIEEDVEQNHSSMKPPTANGRWGTDSPRHKVMMGQLFKHPPEANWVARSGGREEHAGGMYQVFEKDRRGRLDWMDN